MTHSSILTFIGKAIQKKAKQEKPVPKLEGKPGEKPRQKKNFLIKYMELQKNDPKILY